MNKKITPTKNRILIDLDVLTVAKWDKSNNGDLARKFLKRIEIGEFKLLTPYIILDLLSEWKHIKLAKEIKEFYELYSLEIISVTNLEEKLKEMSVDRKSLINDLESYNIKDEDIIIVIITCIFDVYYLVTFNRKHLKNNEENINNVLQKYGLRPIQIVLPDGI